MLIEVGVDIFEVLLHANMDGILIEVRLLDPLTDDIMDFFHLLFLFLLLHIDHLLLLFLEDSLLALQEEVIVARDLLGELGWLEQVLLQDEVDEIKEGLLLQSIVPLVLSLLPLQFLILLQESYLSIVVGPDDSYEHVEYAQDHADFVGNEEHPRQGGIHAVHLLVVKVRVQHLEQSQNGINNPVVFFHLHAKDGLASDGKAYDDEAEESDKEGKVVDGGFKDVGEEGELLGEGKEGQG
eukprot:CAMPEP_0170567782 /NCGR_PEP_ID=MMETSP0211-20121228/80706_1 /TAXON_ID=311385 /ORGANISM="Pseudokeronopsis sp., Strain OXSARD2" /LENGTH=238 /DNA_ID=CAMNT_0010889347 /DNA_START=158 /DNA_END=870 /DNA_ORIENTATION=+